MFTMDGAKRISIGEGVPLNTADMPNIFLDTGKNIKTTKSKDDGTTIHLKSDRTGDLGVHINTTLSIASSKKIKALFMLNFLLSVICVVISCSVAVYYWNEITSMRKQLDTIKDQFMTQNLKNNQVKVEASPLIAGNRQIFKGIDLREPKMETGAKIDISSNTRQFFVEELGEDVLLVDSSKKNPSTDKAPVYNLPILNKDPVIVHFNGALNETVIKSIVGPWIRDTVVSTKNSETKIELHNDYLTIKEDGLYLVYVQLVYVTHAPYCFYIFARQPGQTARLLSTCATGDDSTNRQLLYAQISCSTQTVARLYNGDIVNIAQRERNKTLWLRPGYSYFGFVKLSS